MIGIAQRPMISTGSSRSSGAKALATLAVFARADDAAQVFHQALESVWIDHGSLELVEQGMAAPPVKRRRESNVNEASPPAPESGCAMGSGERGQRGSH